MNSYQTPIVFVFSVCSLLPAAYDYNPLKAVYTVKPIAFDARAVAAIEASIGYTFNKKSRLEKAFTTEKKNPNANLEIYEYKGDAVLKLVQGELIHKKFPQATPYERTEIKSAIESLAPLCALGVKLGLHTYVQDITQDIKANVVEDVIEALVWALHKDGGKDAAERFITRFFYPMIKGCVMVPCNPGRAISLAHPGKVASFRKLAIEGEFVCDVEIRDKISPDESCLQRVNYRLKNKKDDPASRIAEYNAAMKYVREHLPIEYQQQLITWPLDSNYQPFEERLKLDVDWLVCNENARTRLHNLCAMMRMDQPVYHDEQMSDGMFMSTIRNALGVFEGASAATKKKAQEYAAQKALQILQSNILLAHVQHISLDDLTLLYVDNLGEGLSAKSKINNICKRFNLEQPAIDVRIRAGAVSEPLQYYAVVQAPWLPVSFKSPIVASRAEAKAEGCKEVIRSLYRWKKRVPKAFIKPVTLMLICAIESGLADSSKSNKELVNILADKLEKDRPSMKVFYADSSLAEHPNPLFECRLSFEDVTIKSDPKMSMQAAQDDAARLFLVRWLRDIKQDLFARI